MSLKDPISPLSNRSRQLRSGSYSTARTLSDPEKEKLRLGMVGRIKEKRSERITTHLPARLPGPAVVNVLRCSRRIHRLISLGLLWSARWVR